MSHVYKTSIWDESGKIFHCNDIEDLGNNSALWYIPARILGITPAAYIKLMIEKFNAKVSYLPKSAIILFQWDNYNDCNKYKLFINKKARERKFII